MKKKSASKSQLSAPTPKQINKPLEVVLKAHSNKAL